MVASLCISSQSAPFHCSNSTCSFRSSSSAMVISLQQPVTTRSQGPSQALHVSVSPNRNRFPPLQLRSARPGGDSQRRREAMRKHAFTVYGGFESDQPRGSEEPGMREAAHM
ncbi:hypothetical protein, variant [Cryptococcus amylolentus CBS 6039]|uniref:Uncharacterized protein n=1 Tax=Cryptococcus amylolentus CBS 6039 TaxID=1295533 RepID=A0A1E3HT93_9TREE|nr:hypothetical protein L202_03527 [Cryptococcus amylolentus CBS 6039]XP_018994426.1 hypothetical protein, variant [Cryptococcus amylolentus CBS 6039]ODN79578.1 hypothetical protein L202_03527 [Cryptococcus amylolentus CBS 6039]ODN79579.1 hypothetical protein, variant [Cryptococcus amylolentus CBS 6039]